MKRKLLVALLSVLAVLTASLAFAACGKKEGEKPTPTPEPAQIAGAVDRHIRAGDENYDFLAGVTPAGVACDTSAVDFSAAGEYEIVYSAPGLERVTKKAYVYTAPALYLDGEAFAERAEMTWEQAEVADFDSPSAMGVSAKDCFGAEIAVTVQAVSAYAGKVGECVYRYTAADAAGNTAEGRRTYAVAFSVQPPEISVEPFDVTAGKVSVPFAWGGVEAAGLLLDGQPLTEQEDYAINTGEGGGFTVEAAAFGGREVPEEGLSCTLTVKTDLWYRDVPLTVTDNQPARFTLKDGYAFKIAGSVELPLPERTVPAQNFELVYECEKAVVAGTDEAIVVSGQDGGKLSAGSYTVRVSPVRYGKPAGETQSMTFTVYKAKEWAKIIALGTSDQYENNVYCDVFNEAGEYEIGFDPAAGAFRYRVASGHYGVALSGDPWSKYLDGYASNDCLAVDVRFAEEGKQRLVFWQGKGGERWLQPASLGESNMFLVYETEGAKTSVSYDDMKPGVWYTIVLDDLMGPPSAVWNQIFAVFGTGELHFRNLRFTDYGEFAGTPDLSEKERYDNFIYAQSAEPVKLPDFGAAFVIYDKLEKKEKEGWVPVELEKGYLFVPSEVGEYRATLGEGETISFTVVLEADFDKIIDPGNGSAQFAGGLYNGMTEEAFEYDPVNQAYHYEATKGAQQNDLVFLRGAALSAYQSKYPDYAALAVDIKFSAKQGLVFWQKPKEYYYGVNGEETCALVFASEDSSQSYVPYDEIQLNVWYTVVVRDLGGVSDTRWFPGVFGMFGAGEMYFRNLRFADAGEFAAAPAASAQAAYDGFLYGQSETAADLPDFGRVFTQYAKVERKTGDSWTEIPVLFGYKFVPKELGEYRAVLAGAENLSVTFTVLPAAEFDAIIDPGNGNAQFAGGLCNMKPDGTPVVYDSEQGGYHYLSVGNGASTSEIVGLVFGHKTMAEYQKKFAGYESMTVEVKFAKKTPLVFWQGKNTYFWGVDGQTGATVYRTDDAEKTPVSFAEAQNGVWYTVKVSGLGGVVSNEYTALFASFQNAGGELYFRNLRFEGLK